MSEANITITSSFFTARLNVHGIDLKTVDFPREVFSSQLLISLKKQDAAALSVS